MFISLELKNVWKVTWPKSLPINCFQSLGFSYIISYRTVSHQIIVIVTVCHIIFLQQHPQHKVIHPPGLICHTIRHEQLNRYLSDHTHITNRFIQKPWLSLWLASPSTTPPCPNLIKTVLHRFKFNVYTYSCKLQL